jgi:two-component system, cell cycle sensor histidine kinase and response regulator CckA
MADPGQLHQVLMNLVVNARDAMRGGGCLTITTANRVLDAEAAAAHPGVKPGAYAALCVADTGEGMSEEVRQRIFEPFFTTKGIGEGTGLGLSVVYGIVQQSGGAITVESEPGRGSAFTILLPQTDVRQSWSAPAEDAAGSLKGTETVLVVEDQEQVREFAAAVLASYGYRVLKAVSGDEALHILDAHPRAIDLILTDLVMPGMTGKELADRLQLLNPGMRVVFMSGYSDDVIAHRGLTAASDYLAKPFSPGALAFKVRAALDTR